VVVDEPAGSATEDLLFVTGGFVVFLPLPMAEGLALLRFVVDLRVGFFCEGTSGGFELSFLESRFTGEEAS